jgi:hypothetical protein
LSAHAKHSKGQQSCLTPLGYVRISLFSGLPEEIAWRIWFKNNTAAAAIANHGSAPISAAEPQGFPAR